MKSAYDETNVYNLAVIKETRRWKESHFIDQPQFDAIKIAYTTPFYHPNTIIRVMLFIASLLALSGVTGFFVLIFVDIGEIGLSLASIIYGVASLIVLEKIFIRSNHHYKSGVTDALLYHSCAFLIGGLGGISEWNPHIIIWSCLFVFLFTAYRYLDYLCTIAATLSLAAIVFFEFYTMGGVFQQIIPFLFIIVFTPVYFSSVFLKRKRENKVWRGNLLVVESVSLLLIYLGGNYLVVRELSVAMMNVQLTDGNDIPFAFVFYALTILIPVVFLFFGVRNKNIVLLRVSLILLAASVFTFKYYYNFGHPEITLTIAGTILILIAIGLMNYLKTIRHGFTRENLLTEKWAGSNVQAFIISQTMGGNTSVDSKLHGGGGTFGGGGSTGEF